MGTSYRSVRPERAASSQAGTAGRLPPLASPGLWPNPPPAGPSPLASLTRQERGARPAQTTGSRPSFTRGGPCPALPASAGGARGTAGALARRFFLVASCAAAEGRAAGSSRRGAPPAQVPGAAVLSRGGSGAGKSKRTNHEVPAPRRVRSWGELRAGGGSAVVRRPEGPTRAPVRSALSAPSPACLSPLPLPVGGGDERGCCPSSPPLSPSACSPWSVGAQDDTPGAL